MNAQNIKDFNTDKVRTAKRYYDELFNVYARITLKNISTKYITSLEIRFYFERTDMKDDPFTREAARRYGYSESKIVQVGIAPDTKETFDVFIPKAHNGYESYGYYISKVRFHDGSICQ